MKKETNTQKGALPILISILVVLVVVGGGAYLYKQSNLNKDNSNDAMQMDRSYDNAAASGSPKDIFLTRNDALFKARTFDDMIDAAAKYDSALRIQEGKATLSGIPDEKKNAYLAFAQGLMVPSSDLYDIEEVIDGDKATVTALDGKGSRVTAQFIMEDGGWKISDMQTSVTGEE